MEDTSGVLFRFVRKAYAWWTGKDIVVVDSESDLPPASRSRDRLSFLPRDQHDDSGFPHPISNDSSQSPIHSPDPSFLQENNSPIFSPSHPPLPDNTPEALGRPFPQVPDPPSLQEAASFSRSQAGVSAHLLQDASKTYQDQRSQLISAIAMQKELEPEEVEAYSTLLKSQARRTRRARRYQESLGGGGATSTVPTGSLDLVSSFLPTNSENYSSILRPSFSSQTITRKRSRLIPTTPHPPISTSTYTSFSSQPTRPPKQIRRHSPPREEHSPPIASITAQRIINALEDLDTSSPTRLPLVRSTTAPLYRSSVLSHPDPPPMGASLSKRPDRSRANLFARQTRSSSVAVSFQAPTFDVATRKRPKEQEEREDPFLWRFTQKKKRVNGSKTDIASDTQKNQVAGKQISDSSSSDSTISVLRSSLISEAAHVPTALAASSTHPPSTSSLPSTSSSVSSLSTDPHQLSQQTRPSAKIRVGGRGCIERRSGRRKRAGRWTGYNG